MRTLADPGRLARSLMPLLALVISFAAAILLGGPGALSYPVPALLWCALSYPLFATSALAFSYILFSLASIDLGSLAVLDDLDSWDAQTSLRLGITLVAIAPLIVASVTYNRRQLLNRLRTLATTDQLTGILNRSAFLESAEQRLRELVAAQQPVALLMIDIDRFKAVNDTYGHAAGDQTLVAVAGAIRSALPPGAFVGRLGGEEFGALLPAAGEAFAGQVAERARAACAASAIVLADGQRVSATISVGLVQLPAALGSTAELLAAADRALYRAKRTGRNRVEVEAPPHAGAGLPLPAPA